MFILYCVSLSKGLSCFVQFAKECNYFRVIFLFFWQFITNKIRSCSQDWIICFLSFYFRILFHSVFCFMLFLLQQDFVNCRYSANLKILKTKVNMTATEFERRRRILIRVANLLKRVYRATFATCHFWPKWHKRFSELPYYPYVSAQRPFLDFG